MKAQLSMLLPLVLSGCIQTTGGRLVTFQAQASADPTVVTGGPLEFTTPRGFVVTLSRAHVTVGAVYLNQQNPQNYALEQSCIQEGIYSGEVLGGLTIDALSPVPQAFPVGGNGTDALTRAGELWLTGGDLLAESDKTILLDVAGVAMRGAEAFPFEGQITISDNRRQPPRNPALPGSNPLCRQRIVSPIPFEIRLEEGGTLWLQVDARAWFAAVDFAELTKVSDDPLLYRFVDDSFSSAQPDKALYAAFRSAVGPYRFMFLSP